MKFNTSRWLIAMEEAEREGTFFGSLSLLEPGRHRYIGNSVYVFADMRQYEMVLFYEYVYIYRENNGRYTNI